MPLTLSFLIQVQSAFRIEVPDRKVDDETSHTSYFERATFKPIPILAGSDAQLIDRTLHFKATPGDPSYGVLQSRYLIERAEIKDFTSTFTLNDDATFT